LTRTAYAAAIVWALVSVGASWRDALRRPADPIVSLEAEFQALAPALPPSGAVGFLRFHVDDDRADRLRVFYAAQYALAPRLIQKRTDLELLIVVPDALRPGVDDRLADFTVVASSKTGYRVYQRRVK
jgi:hypothetical protein